jgi:hypothetical protein
MTLFMTAPLIIGGLIIVSAFLIKRYPVNSNWWFALYTEEQKAEANRHIAKLMIWFGSGFCLLGLLPLPVPDFKGLKAGTIAVLLSLCLSIIWRLSKTHIRKKFGH